MANETPSLPEGVGMRLEDAKALLARVHDTNVDADDPVLMLVTLHNAFLQDYETLLARHHHAMTSLLAAKGEAYLADVRQASDVLAKEFSAASVATIQATFREHGAALKAFRRDLFWLTGVIVVAALAILAALLLPGVAS